MQLYLFTLMLYVIGKKTEKQSHQNVIIVIWKVVDDVIFFLYAIYIFHNKQLLLLKSENKTVI